MADLTPDSFMGSPGNAGPPLTPDAYMRSLLPVSRQLPNPHQAAQDATLQARILAEAMTRPPAAAPAAPPPPAGLASGDPDLAATEYRAENQPFTAADMGNLNPNPYEGQLISELPFVAGPMQMGKGAKNLVTGGGEGRLRGASDIVRGGMEAATPAIPGALAKAPLGTLAGLGAGIGAQQISEPLLRKLGLSPGGAALSSDAIALLTGALAGGGAHKIEGAVDHYAGIGERVMEAPANPDVFMRNQIALPDQAAKFERLPQEEKERRAKELAAREGAEQKPPMPPAQASAEAFQQHGATWAELFDQADKLEAKRARTKPEVPATGEPEQVSRVTDARERLAQKLTGKPWTGVTNSEANVIDELIVKGYGMAAEPAAAKTTKEKPNATQLQHPVDREQPWPEAQGDGQLIRGQGRPSGFAPRSGQTPGAKSASQEQRTAQPGQPAPELVRPPKQPAAPQEAVKPNTASGSPVELPEKIAARKVENLPPQNVTAPREPATKPAYGRDVTVKVPGETTEYDGRYAIREAADVHPSHNPVSFAENPEYEHTNERDYQDAGNAARVVHNSGPAFDPDYLTGENTTAEHGAPVIDPRGNALGGNNRTMTLKRVYEMNPEGEAAYRQQLGERVAERGIDPAELGRFKDPVLVRELPNVDNPEAAIRDFNKKGAADLGPHEQAVADGKRLSSETAAAIAGKLGEVGEGSTLAQALQGDNGAEILNRMVKDGAMTEQEAHGYLGGGKLTPEAKHRIAAALVGRLFPDARTLANTPPELRGKLERVAPQVMRLEGRPDWDVTPQLREGLTVLEDARAHGLKNFEDLVNQPDMEGKVRSYSPEALAVAKVLRNGPNAAAGAFRRFANDEALSRPGAPATMFEPPTRAEAFRDAFMGNGKHPVVAGEGERGSFSRKRSKPDERQGGLFDLTDSDIPPAIGEEKPAVPAPKQGAKLSPEDRITAALKQAQPGEGLVTAMGKVRAAVPDLSKEQFDRAAENLLRDRRVWLHDHSAPHTLGPTDQSELVKLTRPNGEDRYYGGMASRTPEPVEDNAPGSPQKDAFGAMRDVAAGYNDKLAKDRAELQLNQPISREEQLRRLRRGDVNREPSMFGEDRPQGEQGGLFGSEKGGVSANLATLGGVEFARQDVIPALKGATGKAKTIVKGLVQALDPRVGVKRDFLDAVYKLKGDREHANYVLQAATERMRQALGSKADMEVANAIAAARTDLTARGLSSIEAMGVDFIDRMKTGQKQLTPELQNTADFLRQADDALYKQIAHYKDPRYLENHFRVMWKREPLAPGPGQPNLQGSKGYFHRHIFDDMSQGIEAGGIPASYNPMELFTRHYADAQEYITAQKWWAQAGDLGAREFVPFGERPPEGFDRLNDRIALDYLHIDPGGRGQWYVEHGMARLMNNYLSHDYLRDEGTALGSLGKVALAVKNAYTSVELLGGFHYGFVTAEAGGSSVGLGISKFVNRGLLQGDWRAAASALGDISKGMTVAPAAREAFRFGKSGMEMVKDPQQFAQTPEGQALLKTFPDAHKLMEDIFDGGAKLDVHHEYIRNGIDSFKQALHSGNFPGALLRGAPAVAEAIQKPLFEWYIPRLKVGVFMKEFSEQLMQRQGDLASGKLTRPQLARQTWDFVEDRFGEMNYDNLFWNRTMKTALQIALRAPLWKLGSMRAAGKAVIGQGRELAAAATEKRMPRVTPEASWMLGMATLTAAYGTIATKALTGQWPQTIKDIIFPRSDPNDDRARLSFPTYAKEYYQAAKAPGEYVAGGEAGLWSKAGDVLRNRDYFNQQIWGDNDPAYKKVLEAAAHMAPAPISLLRLRQALDEPHGKTLAALSQVGVQRAPRSISMTPAEETANRLMRDRTPPEARTREEVERSRLRGRLRESLAHGEGIPDEVRQAVRAGKLSRRDVTDSQRQSRLTPLQRTVNRLGLEEALKVYGAADAGERKSLRPMLARKAEALKDQPPEARVRMTEKLRAALSKR